MQYLIHIGYPKAASSLLQSTLFSGQDLSIKPLNIKNEPYIGYQKSGGRLFFNEQDNGKNFMDPLVFNPQEVLSSIRERENKKAQVTCLSNELWAGHPYSGGVTAKEYADRFYKTLPEAKILIVTRNQVDMIFSSYVHFIVNSRGLCSLEEFLGSDQHTQMPFHHFNYYNYHKLVFYYQSLFGNENVCVLPFEVLVKQSQQAFFKRIYDFLGVSSHDSFKIGEKNSADYKKYVLLRKCLFLNVLARGGPINSYNAPKLLSIRDATLNTLQRVVSDNSIKRAIEQDKMIIQSHIPSYILESNKKLQSSVQEDLKSLGYLLD